MLLSLSVLHKDRFVCWVLIPTPWTECDCVRILMQSAWIHSKRRADIHTFDSQSKRKIYIQIAVTKTCQKIVYQHSFLCRYGWHSDCDQRSRLVYLVAELGVCRRAWQSAQFKCANSCKSTTFEYRQSVSLRLMSWPWTSLDFDEIDSMFVTHVIGYLEMANDRHAFLGARFSNIRQRG